MHRRTFLKSGTLLTAALATSQASAFALWKNNEQKRVVLVGTGIRGSSLWGRNLVENYGEQVKFVGLCDINPGRVAFVKGAMGVDCPTFTDFDKMMKETKPGWVIVTTMDSTHDEFIIRAMEHGANVITEKPMTTTAEKVQAILEAQQRTGRKVLVTFNYRHSPHNTALKQLLHDKRVGEITSVDFNWYLNVHHGASYFRRWHAYQENSGSLWVHKATHHFDLLNWWVNAKPVAVTAMGALEHYGKNGPFRGESCRTCPHKNECPYFWDITKNEYYMDLYVDNEEYDGYIRDSCVFREDIDIYDKMSAQILYDNDVVVNYSLTTYSPYEGYRIAFNGHDGRIDSWEDIPFQKGEYSKEEQASLHSDEMTFKTEEVPTEFHEIIVHENFEPNFESIKVPKYRYGHGGGDRRMLDYLFVNPDAADPLGHMAGTEDGAYSVLIGVAARKSIEEGRTVRIDELVKV
ncbi:Gfo/Idh/MocA family oxidoreductase [Neolewinella marina]|uniref:4,5-dihydroxyphthalate dehydrogenase n=1 Tax=Neolewinella marina TaxID=438751 RepID=A0A2G0CF90_9BACT|nr:Gfo/Idh/MocA family oxidoreductase [Neolewinella marina]PHK98590.1 4,5-dihydroxyphthalate dehydrogenase [Neolewinella marina]